MTPRVPAGPQLVPVLAAIQRFAGPAITVLGAVVLVGWLLHIQILTTVLPGLVSMKVNTAIWLGSLGIARVLSAGGTGRDRHFEMVAAALTLAVAAGAVATLLEYATGADLGIDNALIPDLGAGNDPPGRPAPATVVAVLSLGIATLAGMRGGRLARLVADVAALVALAMAAAALLGIAYGANDIVGGGALFRVALPTAVAIAVLSIALLLDGVPRGVAGSFASPSVGGLFARRFGLGVLVLLPTVGWIRRLGEERGYYDSATGLVFMVVGSGLVLAGYGLWASRRLVHTEEVAEAANARATWLASHFPNGAILAFDRDLRFTVAGGAALEVVAAPSDQIVGKTHAEAFPGRGTEPLLRAALDGEERTVETQFAGRIFHTTVTPLRGADGSVIGGLVVALDITARRAVERQLETLNAELQDYAGIVSHDLQAPLRRIELFAAHLRKVEATGLAPESMDALRRIETSSAHLQQLVQDLLAYARAGRQAMTFAPVDLNALVSSIVREIGPEVSQREAVLSIGDLPVIEADSGQLRQLFTNLLQNALKFSVADRAPHISIASHASEASDADAWVIEVVDDGPGFDPSMQDEIFGLFRRLPGAEDRDGTGLGLAICRRVAERHRGSIDAIGVPGVGATFRVTLPAHQPRAEPDA